ncbi:alpha-glucan family phosphorylase [Conexibacter sp. SYSU D00693]|uniref:alpha-glucan family phosphorylase n=1 Tax=Conexibacter sp. SYSU D00693 TaxID=2812560 RepID=UPI00196ACF76|nr:alpha-glucan family phosphorylase [Conexibacter sp. SYSU D00693]
MTHATTTSDAGAADLAAEVADLAERLPGPLRPLARVAYDLRWSWDPDGPPTFAAIAPSLWEAVGHNPVRLLREVRLANLRAAAADEALVGRAAALEARVEGPPRPVASGGVAYFCAEFALHRSLPGYGGGLGVLAGDILKEASDLALPMVGVGLLYRQGAAHQRTDASGWQHDWWSTAQPDALPMALVTGGDGKPVLVSVPVGDREVVAQLWRVDVGRVPLLLLDADRPENDAIGRWTTARLYDGDPETRLAQYALLGAGGVRALRAVGIDPAVVHLNEGHAALAALELACVEREAGADPQEALARARAKTIFTTHTPVPAGNDTYPPHQVAEQLGRLCEQAGIAPEQLVRLGRTTPDDEQEPLGVTQLALRTSRAANGVAERHGHVSRGMWRGVWPDREEADVPIGHVTNGVHLPTWLGRPMRALLDRTFGEGWTARADDPATWQALDDVPDEELWAVRNAQRAQLIALARERGARDRLVRGDQRAYVAAAERSLDPDVLTLGFARRIATYKRIGLLVADRERALALLGGEHPVQLLIAGKAHPRDEEAKRTLQGVFELKQDPRVAERVVFLDDYDVALGAALTQGCDVWLNVPRPPLEASGTSGMKSAANGGLNVSVLDGWWAEAFDGSNGWGLDGSVEHGDQGARDWRDAGAMLDVLGGEVAPMFHRRDAQGLPREWLQLVRNSLKTNGPRFSATRMVRDYARDMYGLG